MAKNPAISAVKRTITGRKVKKLRREGKIPANIFGNKIDSQSLTLDNTSFLKVAKDLGESTVVDVTIEGESKARPVLLSSIQEDPITGDILHVDLKQVDLTVKVVASVALEVTGEAPGVKEHSAVLLTPVNEVEVEALPNDLPDSIEVDVSSLQEIGDSIMVSDLKVGNKVKLITDADTMIATLQEQQEEEVEETPETTEGEVGQEMASDGETASADSDGDSQAQANESDAKKE